MKKLLMAGLLGLVSVSALGDDIKFHLKVTNNTKENSVLSMGLGNVCSTIKDADGYTKPGAQDVDHALNRGEILFACLGQRPCQITLYASNNTQCKGATKIGSVKLNPDNIGAEGNLFVGATSGTSDSGQFNWSVVPEEKTNNTVATLTVGQTAP